MDKPAFPIPIAGCTDGSVYNTMEQSAGQLGGMTLREYAAVAAMQGLLGSPDYPHGFEALADDAVRQADALLARMEEVNPKKRPIDNHTGQQYEWCGCGRWVIHGTSHPTLTSCNCGAWYKPHVAREEKP